MGLFGLAAKNKKFTLSALFYGKGGEHVDAKMMYLERFVKWEVELI